MRPTILILPLVLFSTTLATPKWHPPPQDFGDKWAWEPIWSDDFNAARKHVAPEGTNWKLGEGQYSYPGEKDSNTTYVNAPPFLQISDVGTLIITSRRSVDKGRKAGDDAWWSGKVESNLDFLPTAGKKTLVEARIKIGDALSDHLAGISQRIYSLTPDFWKEASSWPRMGEWEILELKNGAESFVPALYCGESEDGPCKKPEGFNPGAAYTFSRGTFHRVGFEIDRSMCAVLSDESECWREELVTWILDYHPMYKVKGSELGDKDAWSRLFHHKRIIGMGVTVGGSRVGMPNELTAEGESAGMEIDYVGVWESKDPTTIIP